MAIVNASTYDILIDEDYTKLNAYVESLSPSKIIIIVDENTEQYCLPKIKKNLHQDFLSIKIPSGEKYKSISTCQGLWETLIKHNCDRQSLIINLGGGVIGDMGGFVAGTYMRGIRFIQIPTSLLSQVDASVGGKLAIDLSNYKNIVGLFLEPQMVWVDTSFIQTLPQIELRSGYAEIIKHALIRSKALWQKINNRQLDYSPEEWSTLITDNISIKNFVVKQDFKEGGLRKVLNFGHTIGHSIESHFLNSSTPLTHGEAIAVGMICESYISHQEGLISESELSEISSYIISLYPININLTTISTELIKIMGHDKKNVSGQTLFSLITSIGDSTYDVHVDNDIIIKALGYYDSAILK